MKNLKNKVTFCSLIGIPLLAVYLSSSLSFGAPMFSNEWKQNRRKYIEQQGLEEQIQKQSYYRKQFHKLDLDNNYVIDSTEFIYRK